MSLEAAEAVVKVRIAHKDEHLVLGVTYAAAGLLDAPKPSSVRWRPQIRVERGSKFLRSLREMRTGQK